jgi:hypothetical protein
MPENATYVGRTGGRFCWGNPARVGMHFKIGEKFNGQKPYHAYFCVPEMFADETFTYVDSAATAVDLFRKLIDNGYMSRGLIEGLRGRDLVCWCRLDQPCHADVLLEIANSPADTNGE